MANVNIQLDDHIYAQLQALAKKHDISMEEEAHQIISQAVAAPERIGNVFKKYFGARNGVNLKIPRYKPHNPADIDK